MNRSNYTLKFCLIQLFSLFSFVSVWGQLHHWEQRIHTDPYNPIPVTIGQPSAIVQTTASNPGIIIQSDLKIHNRLTFSVNLGYPNYFPNAQKTKIKMSVNRTNGLPTSDTTIYMEVEYRPDQTGEFKQKNVVEFLGYKRVTAVIDSIYVNGVSQNVLPANLVLQNEIFAIRNTILLTVSNQVQGINVNNPLNLNCDDAEGDAITVSWTPNIGALEYQLEWVYINDYSNNGINGAKSPASLFYNFKENATRITTRNTTYRINNVFDRGWIIFRIRALGLLNANNSESYYFSNWSLPETGNVGTVPTNHKVQITGNFAHENNLNWQYAATYAEDGKRKEVVSYFDGSLRNRQTVTQINSDKNTIVGETIYDAQGRPAIQVLPVPVLTTDCNNNSGETAIKYYPNFNQAVDDSKYNATHFDYSENEPCAISASPMSEGSGAALYYSPSNPNQVGAQGYVPNANGYPFTQVEYTPDNTGRIRRQSGVGPEFQLGSGHETKYFYGQPNQLELNRLFGSEVGYSLHYKKNMVVDANGQVSISYLDQEGRVIATALAGNAPDALSELNSGTNAAVALTINALGQNNVSNLPTTDNQGYLFSTQLVLGYATDLTFAYNFSMPPIQDACLPNVCFDCVYDLKIELVDECGVNWMPEDLNGKLVGKFQQGENGVSFHANCVAPLNGNAGVSNFTVENVPVGNYSLNKRLMIHDPARVAYIERFMTDTNNTCVKTFEDFLAEELALIDTAACNPTCESCQADLGTLNDFVAAGKGTAQDYYQARENCNLICSGNEPSFCEISLMAMRVDMMPGGQYAGYMNPAQDEVDLSYHPLSVLRDNNMLPDGNAFWRNPKLMGFDNFPSYYADENGDTSRIYLSINSQGWVPKVNTGAVIKYNSLTQQAYIYPEELLELNDFIDLFDFNWTKSLVLYHPEWCYYEHCATFDKKKNASDAFSSRDFDLKMEETRTFEKAVQNGFLNSDLAFIFNSGTPVTVTNVVNNWFQPTGNNPQNNTTMWDAFAYFNGTETNCNGYGQTLQNAYNQMQNFGGTWRTMPELAAYLTRCSNLNVSNPPAYCFDFGGKYNNVYNIEILNKEWNLLKGFYRSKKMAIQQQYLDCKAINDCGQYGGCIGVEDFDPSVPLPPYLGAVHSSWDFTAPCGNYTKFLYANKQRRFPRNEHLSNSVSSGQSAYEFYRQTGQCPSDFALENLLNELAYSNKLNVNNVNISNLSNFMGFYFGMNNFEMGATAPPLVQQANVAGNVLTLNWVNILDTSIAHTITLQNNHPTLQFTDFNALTRLRSTGGSNFKIYALKLNNGVIVDSTRLEGTISAYALGACVFEQECTTNQLAKSMQELLNILIPNGLLNPDTTFSLRQVVLPNNMTLNLQRPIFEGAAGYTDTLYVSNEQGNNGGIWIGYFASSVFYGLEMRFLSFTNTEIFDSAAIAYVSDWESIGEHLFKLKVHRADGAYAEMTGALYRHHPTQTLVGLPSGTCGAIQPQSCKTTQHLLFNDFSAVLKERINTSLATGNPNFNLFQSIHFSTLLREQFASNLTSTTFSYNAGTDTLVINGAKCQIGFTIPGTYNLSQLTKIGEMNVYGSPDPEGNYYLFSIEATVDINGTLIDTLILGRTCFPLRACTSCENSALTAELFSNSEEGGMQGFNASEPGEPLSCEDRYQAYLDFYETTSYFAAGIPPVPITEFPPCLGALKANDPCYEAYNHYMECATAFNSWAAVDSLRPQFPYEIPLPSMEQFKLAKVCGCADQYCARLQAVRDGLVSFASEAEFLAYLAPQKVCPQPCEVAADSTLGWVNIPADSVELTLGDQCLETLINQAHYSAQVRYEQYLDSLQSVLNERYRQHCMGVVENFTYTYTDKQHHYTLYYYDQAGNLIRTVPPGGVEVLNITSENDALNQQINADRLHGQKTVFTQHRLVTRYEYNSLNQLVAQFTPDTDPMNEFELYLTDGLPAALVTNKIQMIDEFKGYLAGRVGTRGYLFRTNDGGNTWSRVNGIIGTDFNKVKMINATTGFAVGKRGIVMRTTDGGLNWDLLNIWTSAGTGQVRNLNDFDYFSTPTAPNVLTIVGDNGLIIQSENLSTFALKNAVNLLSSSVVVNYQFKSIYNDGTNQFVLGENSSEKRSLILTRANNPVSNFTNNSQFYNGLKINAIDSLNRDLILMGGEDGRLYKNRWVSNFDSIYVFPSNLTQEIIDLKFFNELEGVVISGNKLFRTYDGGTNWTQVATENYTDLSKTEDRSVIVAVGENGKIKLLFPGNNPQLNMSNVPFNQNATIAACWINKNGVGTNSGLSLFLGIGNVIHYSWNVAVQNPVWHSYTTPTANTIRDMYFIQVANNPLVEGLVRASNNRLYRTKIGTGGNAYTLINVSNNPGITSLSKIANNEHFMFTSSNGRLYRSTLIPAATTITQTILNSSVGGSIAAVLAKMDTIKMVGINVSHISKSSTGSYGTNLSQTNKVYPVQLNAITFDNNLNAVVAVGYDGAIYRRSGSSWLLQRFSSNAPIENAKFFGTNLYAIGRNGFCSTLSYNSLAQSYSETPLLLTSGESIASGINEDLYDLAINGSNMYIVGQSGRALYSPNYLSSPFGNLAQGTQDLRSVCAVPNSSRMLIVGDNSTVLQQVNSYFYENKNIFLPEITDLHFMDGLNGVIGARNFNIRQTNDGGLTWKTVIAGNSSHVTAITTAKVWMTNPNKVIIFGVGAAPMRSTDLVAVRLIPHLGGAPTNVLDVSRFGNYLIISSQVGSEAQIRSVSILNDTIISLFTLSSTTINAVEVTSNRNLLIAGVNGVFRSYNWSGVPASNSCTLLHSSVLVNSNINDLAVLNSKEIVLVGERGIYLHSNIATTNSQGQITGISWFAQNGIFSNGLDPYHVTAANQINIKTIDFTNARRGVFGGEYTAQFNSSLYNQETYVRSFYDVLSRYSSRFYYDPLGRLVVSQNARQYNNVGGTGRKYSYTLYDALGRVVEVGEKSENSSYPQFKDIFGAWVSDYYNPSVIDEAKLLDWINGPGERREVTKSYYDATVITGLPATFTPNVLTQRKRITHVTYEETFDNNDQTYDHATHYDYDIHGNVKTLLQDNRKMKEQFSSLASQQFKRLDYRYDLVSGNVHRMSVQNGEVDQWHHAYQYDSDNRITAAYTNSRTPLLSLDRPSSALSNELAENEDWENDAKYEYYAHGPLARTEIGQNSLQGFDYFYTLQGWMKGINAIEDIKDPGEDGLSSHNQFFAKDLAAFSLEYFNDDYTAISGGNITTQIQSSSHPATNSSELFNGNIRYMQTRLTNLTTGAAMPMLNAYKYDQLNRLSQARSYENGLSNGVWNPTSYGNEYFNAFTYDAMGNIENQIRYSRNGTLIDNLTYHYQKSAGKLVRNRLYHLNDAQTNAAAFADDIDNMLTFRPQADRLNVNNNYNYDEEGRLVKDSTEKITKIIWRVDGKIKEIQREPGVNNRTLKFDYDAMGNRIAKHVWKDETWERSTYYLVDAQGNQVSTYDHDVITETTQFNLKENNIYGSSRIGNLNRNVNVLTSTISSNYESVLGGKYYEFSNHLGNVLTVFTDKKIPQDEDNNGKVDEYEIGIVSTADYSPFGVQLDGRTESSWEYRYGFNGMEKDDEFKGQGNSYTTEYRQYDARVGRWLSLDPLMGKFPWQSPYCAMDNNPICIIDPTGLEGEDANCDETPQNPDINLPEVKITAQGLPQSQTIENQKNAILRNGEFADSKYDGYRSTERAFKLAKTMKSLNPRDYIDLYTTYRWDTYDNNVQRGYGSGAVYNGDAAKKEWGDIENDIRFYGKLCAYGLLTAGTTQAVVGNITYLQVINGARTTATIAMNGARLSVTGARMGLGLLKQPFVAAGGSLGAEAQMIAWYKMGSTGADAVGQILQGNNLSTWNWGATFGNLYFSKARYSNAIGAGYSALQGNSLGNVTSNYAVGLLGGKISDFLRKTTMFENNLLKHTIGSTLVPLYFNIGNTYLNPTNPK